MGNRQFNRSVTIKDVGGQQVEILTQGSDTLGNTDDSIVVAAEEYQFESGAGVWERKRGNAEVTILASAARNAAGNSSDLTNHNAKGIMIYVDVTAVSGTSPDLDINIQMKDPVSGDYQGIMENLNISAAGNYIIIVYPGAVETTAFGAIETQGLPLPRTWRIYYTIGGTTPSFTFSIGGAYIV